MEISHAHYLYEKSPFFSHHLCANRKCIFLWLANLLFIKKKNFWRCGKVRSWWWWLLSHLMNMFFFFSMHTRRIFGAREHKRLKLIVKRYYVHIALAMYSKNKKNVEFANLEMEIVICAVYMCVYSYNEINSAVRRVDVQKTNAAQCLPKLIAKKCINFKFYIFKVVGGGSGWLGCHLPSVYKFIFVLYI